MKQKIKHMDFSAVLYDLFAYQLMINTFSNFVTENICNMACNTRKGTFFA